LSNIFFSSSEVVGCNSNLQRTTLKMYLVNLSNPTVYFTYHHV